MDMEIQTQYFNDYGLAIYFYEEYKEEGGWDSIPYYGLLKEGKIGEIVLKAKERLEVTGDFSGNVDDVFDEDLTNAVKRFQYRHTIQSDGIIGRETTNAMNVPVETRISQLYDAKKEWEKLQVQYKRYVVNVPAYEAWALLDGRLEYKTKTIVGRKSRPTVIFSDTVKYLTFSPWWHVPHSIASKDLLEKFQYNPEYIDNFQYQIYFNEEKIDHSLVDWKNFKSGGFPFKVKQKPNEYNALGRVKIMFPNQHDIYMHDTPDKKLFNEDQRIFSSGCVRLERPDLFSLFALSDLGWSLVDVEISMNNKKTTNVILDEEHMIDVNIVYLLSWVEHDGTVRFANDIYGKNASEIK